MYIGRLTTLGGKGCGKWPEARIRSLQLMMASATSVIEIAQRAREASLALQCLPTERKNDALRAIKQLLMDRREVIQEANKKDLEVCYERIQVRALGEKNLNLVAHAKAATAAVAKGQLSSALVKRLDVSGPGGSKFDALLDGLDDVAVLADPVGACARGPAFYTRSPI